MFQSPTIPESADDRPTDSNKMRSVGRHYRCYKHLLMLIKQIIIKNISLTKTNIIQTATKNNGFCRLCNQQVSVETPLVSHKEMMKLKRT